MPANRGDMRPNANDKCMNPTLNLKRQQNQAISLLYGCRGCAFATRMICIAELQCASALAKEVKVGRNS